MLSKKAQYALQALMYMADKNPYQPTLIAEVSQNRSIPIKFLENILLLMRKDGILESKKGKGGGYYFRLAPADIPLARIIRLIDGPIAMLPCVSLYFYERCKNCNENHCGIHDTMVLVRDATLKILENKTVADLSRSPSLIPPVLKSKKSI